MLGEGVDVYLHIHLSRRRMRFRRSGGAYVIMSALLSCLVKLGVDYPSITTLHDQFPHRDGNIMIIAPETNADV